MSQNNVTPDSCPSTFFSLFAVMSVVYDSL